MVCKMTLDKFEALFIIGEKKIKETLVLNRDVTIKKLDAMLRMRMKNWSSLGSTSLQNFKINICLVDDYPDLDYEMSPETIQDLSNVDWNIELQTLKEKFHFNNTNGCDFSFYLQEVPDDEHSESKSNGTDTNQHPLCHKISDKTISDIHKDTNCTSDDKDTMNDVDIQSHVDIADYTNKKDIFSTTFPDYSVKKQDSSIDSDDKEPLTKVNSRGENAGEDIKRLPRGLVNQAMTCYLNSLLQALYMTPEFRNALYKWEYVESPDNDETMSIPFQLQRLFLNLQTSEKMSVETTSLTKSFGWDSSEAWQQHDIQELCRVMFDALEQKFKNTEQANLINQLYEGKMIDYVKCLECNTEKTREDTFLDIPLPVRPFNSNVAYNSIEDALKAFVKYELLEGNNQYHCEKCDKKCDAHKGLKFKKFPYVVTLHLKRFDFDCHSFHRIKLNDRVTFPEFLDLNPFIDLADTLSGQENNCQENNTKMDNGVLPDEGPPCDGNSVENNHENDEANNDEGIETNDNCIATEPKGPYVYELFAIMIHSGSASGGHYYAYIKDFTTQQWFCVNDQSVTLIEPKDIKNTYGGGPARTTYYSSAYNTSTNAYMLMYRQIDPKINAVPMQEEDFPEHLKKLLPKLKEENSNSYRITQQMNVYCVDPKTKMLARTKVSFRKGTTWGDVVAQASTEFGFYRGDTSLIKVFDYQGSTKFKFSTPLCHQSLVDSSTTAVIMELPLLQETMKYDLSILKLNVDEEIAVRPIETIQVNQNVTIGELKMQLSENSWDWSEMEIAKKSNDDFEVLKDDTVLSQLMWDLTFYVGNRLDPNPSITDFSTSKFRALCRTYSKLIYIQVQVPITDKELLDALNISPLKEPSTPTKNAEIDYTEVVNDLPQESKSTLKEPEITSNVPCNTLQLSEIEDRNTPEQSNSEDSSLSDSDRTLVGDPVENNEDEDTELPVYQSLKIKVNSDENFECNTYGLWIAQVSDIEGKLQKYLEPFMGISSEYFIVKSVVSGDAFLAQYPVYNVSLDRKPQFREVKCKIISLNNLFDVKQLYDSTKLEVIILRSDMVWDLKTKLLRLMNAKQPNRYNSCKLWLIYSYQEEDRDIFMFDNECIEFYVEAFLRLVRGMKCYPTNELLRLKRLYDSKTIEVAMYLESNFEDIPQNPSFSKIDCQWNHDEKTVPVFVRRFYPSKQKYDDVELIWVDPSMEWFQYNISRKSGIPTEYLEFVQVRSGTTFAKNLYLWKELMYKSRNHNEWTSEVSASELPRSIIDVIVYRDVREEYPSDMIREDCEIYPDRLKQRRNYVDYRDSPKEIRIRSGIRSSVSRPEKGIKIQVSPNK